jgi:hypothetical protein
MATRVPKHFRLDPVKIKCAQKLLRAGTETETIERALDLVISEHARSRLATEANDRFVTSSIVVKDVYGALERYCRPHLGPLALPASRIPK